MSSTSSAMRRSSSLFIVALQDRALTRYEFLEAVVRLALKKHCSELDDFDRPIVEPAEALHRFMVENVLPNPETGRGGAGHARTQSWRERHLYNEEVDAVFRSYRSLLYIVFAAFAKETLVGSEREGYRTPVDRFSPRTLLAG